MQVALRWRCRMGQGQSAPVRHQQLLRPTATGAPRHLPIAQAPGSPKTRDHPGRTEGNAGWQQSWGTGIVRSCRPSTYPLAVLVDDEQHQPCLGTNSGADHLSDRRGGHSWCCHGTDPPVGCWFSRLHNGAAATSRHIRDWSAVPPQCCRVRRYRPGRNRAHLGLVSLAPEGVNGGGGCCSWNDVGSNCRGCRGSGRPRMSTPGVVRRPVILGGRGR